MFTRWSDLDRTFFVMNELQRRMNRLFHDMDSGRYTEEGPQVTSAWPPVNLYDTGEAFVLKALVPGLAESDIQVTANQDVLTVSGERKDLTPEGYSVHRQERGSVAFSRSFTFPAKVNLERTAASVKDGVLTITLEKAEEARPRQITVKGS